MTDPRLRFSNRVEEYRRYRPGYPGEVLDALRKHGALRPGSEVADIGSGTGILTRLLLDAGHRVYAVEPNLEMRRAAEEDLRAFPGFRSLDGSAEASTLPDASVDLVTAAQAFHWFDPASARREFARILRKDGSVAVLWNERLTGTPFLAAYEDLLLRHAVDYTTVDHRQVSAPALAAFFGPEGFTTEVFPNAQRVDWEGLSGRLLSSSYIPAPGHPGFEAMMAELERLFAAHEKDGQVVIAYATKLYLGRLSG